MRIDFYILDKATQPRTRLYICQWLEKAYAEQRQVYVYTNSKDEAIHFDALLWTFKDDSFIPHEIFQEQKQYHGHYAAPIQIGWQPPPSHIRDVLLNFHDEPPGFFQQFSELVEFVSAESPIKEKARNRYRVYRAEGQAVQTHSITL